MKFSFLVSSILLSATARAATAIDTTCCYADETLGCPNDYEDASLGATSVMNGVQTKMCCLPDVPQVDSLQLCPGTVAPNNGAGTGSTTTTTTGGSLFDGGTFGGTCDELRSQFPGCSCVTQCPGEAAECNDLCDASDCKGLECSVSSSVSETSFENQSESHSETSTSTTTTTTTGNTGAAPSGAGIISSASATIIGASVVIIAIFA